MDFGSPEKYTVKERIIIMFLVISMTYGAVYALVIFVIIIIINRMFNLMIFNKNIINCSSYIYCFLPEIITIIILITPFIILYIWLNAVVDRGNAESNNNMKSNNK